MTDPLRQILTSVRGMRNRGERPPEAVTALFAGPTGTGRTRAAKALADELGGDLLKIDLSRIVSKYIGETEKKIQRVFDEADGAGVVLLVGEADSRSEGQKRC